MFVIKCIPMVGTFVTALEAVEALIEGDGRKFASRLVQTAVGGVMDAAFVMSGGASSIVTAPIKGGVIEGGKIAGKKVVEQIVIREAAKLGTNVAVQAAGKLTTNIAVRAASELIAEEVNESNARNHSQSKASNGACNYR